MYCSLFEKTMKEQILLIAFQKMPWCLNGTITSFYKKFEEVNFLPSHWNYLQSNTISRKFKMAYVKY